MTRSARDEGEGEGLLVDLGSLDLGEAIDDGQNKFAQLIIHVNEKTNKTPIRRLMHMSVEYGL